MIFNPGRRSGWGKIVGDASKLNATRKEVEYKVQCFPLYSILLAVGRTSIDFFSLDVEGHELKAFFYMCYLAYSIAIEMLLTTGFNF